jgi:hypothetical protein
VFNGTHSRIGPIVPLSIELVLTQSSTQLFRVEESNVVEASVRSKSLYDSVCCHC